MAALENGPAPKAAPGRAARPRRRAWAWVLAPASVLLAVFGAFTADSMCRYGVGFGTAAKGVLKEGGLAAIRTAVWVCDPCEPRHAPLGPRPAPDLTGYARIEDVLPPGRVVPLPPAGSAEVRAVSNERIVRGSYPFWYQPYDEPRLHELRRKYRLDEVVAPAATEFEELVLLRNWTRSQFRRSDYQPYTADFDALAVLDRGYRDHGLPFNPAEHFDPCHFFPLLYAQVVLSMGHQARLVAVHHGMTEVWSNQYRKWVLMDAELNHHFERDGVPLNMGELREIFHDPSPDRVRVVQGEQTSGDASTTMVHLKVAELDPESGVAWFAGPLHLVDLRNDWMTNRYFRGHPARSEGNSLVYADPLAPGAAVRFELRLRPITTREEDFYWTLNQAEILARPVPRQGGPGPGGAEGGSGPALDLAFRTVTPNFDHFEVATDGGAASRSDSPYFRWELHEGDNTLTVRPVNRFGVRGIESRVEVFVRPR